MQLRAGIGHDGPAATPNGARRQPGSEDRERSLGNGGGGGTPLVHDTKGGDRKGVVPTGIVAGALSPAGLLVYMIRGKDAVVAEYTEITAYVDEDVVIDPEKLPAAPPQTKSNEAGGKDKGSPQ